jgi:peroxiredoxin
MSRTHLGIFVGLSIFLLIHINIYAIEINDRVPDFEVWDFRQEKNYFSRDFLNHQWNVLIFWNTDCEKCIKALQSTWDQKTGFDKLSVNVITINTNSPNNLYNAIDFSNLSPFPVYYDFDGIVKENYGAIYNDFFVYIIDKQMKVRYILDESLAAAGEKLLEKTQELNLTSFSQSGELSDKNFVIDETSPKVNISGIGKSRYMDINPGAPVARGAYGEELIAGSTFKYYFEPHIRLNFNQKLHLGTFLRITNIKDRNLFGAPDYYSNTLFSPYVQYRFSKKISATVGFYRFNISPLTIMRWDEQDNPPGSGGVESACGICDGLAGGITTENLEQLGPDIGFEGARITAYLTPALNAQFFYSRPLIQAEDCATYHQHLIGGQITNYFFNKNYLQINYIHIFEQAGKCAAGESIIPLLPLKKDHLLSGILQIEQLSPITFSTEFGYFRRSLSAVDTFNIFSVENTEGMAFLFQSELELNLSNTLRYYASGAYLSLDKDYRAPYRALSYLPNRRGFRFRSQISNNFGDLILFYKSLREIEYQPLFNEKSGVRTLGLGSNQKYELFNLSINSYCYYSKEWKNPNTALSAKENRRIISLAIKAEITKQFNIMATYQNVFEELTSRTLNSNLFALYNFVYF